MVAIYLVYGLAFFGLGLAVGLEARRSSQLPLGRQLPWLAAFGLTHSVVEWSDMLLLTGPIEPWRGILLVARTILLPLSTLFLIRFGVGLFGEAGPPPKWMLFVPLFLFAPAAFLIAYALIIATTDPYIATDVWSRYLLYFTGSLLTAIGFLRQRNAFTGTGLAQARNLMLAAAVAFGFNALVAGLVVPPAPYGLAPWLNYENVLDLTGIPVQVWRLASAVAVTIFVIRALGVFEAEREQRLAALEASRREAEAILKESEERFRTVFELAPIGMDLVRPDGRPFKVNRAFQEMMGYSESELCEQRFIDYTHPEDVDSSLALVQEVASGQREHFRMQKRYVHKDGQVVWGNVYVSAVRNPEGGVGYFIAMVEDITERRRMEEALAAEQFARLQSQLEGRQTAEQWVDCLVDISRRIAHMDTVDDVLLHIVRQARELLDCDLVSIGLLNEGGSEVMLKYQAAGDRAYVLDTPVTVRSTKLIQILSGGLPYYSPHNGEQREIEWHCPTVARRVQAAAIMPLKFDDRIIGGLWISRFKKSDWSDTQLVGLESLADQTVIALQHALMASRMQSIAVMEERSRIAREMHDGLAQILGYLNLQVQTLEALVEQGDDERILAELKQTRDNIKIAQADVRENILSLRTTLAGDNSVIEALQEYVSEFDLQTSQETRIINRLDGPPRLSSLAELQLVRIVQEALANVRKHSQAKNAEVILSEQDDCLQVVIADDGSGFEPYEAHHHFGLQTMRERAESVGGGLRVQSVRRKGTRVELWLPLLQE